MQRSILYLFAMLILLHGGCAHPHEALRRRPLVEIWLSDVRETFCTYPVARTPVMAPVQSDIAPEAEVSQYAPPPLSLDEWVAELGGSSEVVSDKTLRVVLNEAPVTGRLTEMPTPDSVSDLELNDVELTDADWPVLKAMHSLSILQLNGTSCDDQRLHLLTNLKSLELLSIARTNISNQGLKQLAEMHQLRFLILDETSIDDEGVFYLKQMKHLEGLSLVGTNVSASQIENLKAELTDCTIVSRTPQNIPFPAPDLTGSIDPESMPVIRPENEHTLPVETVALIESRPLCAWSANGESVAMYVPGDGCITVAVRDQAKPRKIPVKDSCIELGFGNGDTVLAVMRSQSGRLGLQRWNALSGVPISQASLSADIASVQFVFGSPLMMLEGHDGTTQLVNYESEEVIWKDGTLLPQTTVPSASKQTFNSARNHDLAIPVFR